MHKAAKAKSGGRATSQPSRGATSTQKLGEAQRLRVGRQANFPKQSRRLIPELISGTEVSIKN
jgi:hypothetical protein